ncbi:MAG: L-threonylcarbamoyladenylate synthase [Minisyncoccota bacterium]
MKTFKTFCSSSVEILKNGGVGVIPTDTIYGIVGSALYKNAVKKIYGLRKRNLKKPMIILIGSINDLKLFGIKLDLKIKRTLSEIWPNKISVILPCKNNKYSYLHRGSGSLAFRFPKNKELIDFIKKTGPLVAPSANIEGFKSSKSIKDAKKCFKDQVDFYIDFGIKVSMPSTIIKIHKGETIILREGAVKL